MSIQRLTFTHQLAQIGTRSRNAQMNITMPKGQMTIQNGKSAIQVSTQIPRFQGNRKQVNNESGLMDPLTFAKQFRNKGNQKAAQATANYARDGDFLANPRIPGDKSVPRLAANKMKRVLGPKEKNIGLMPSSIPSLQWDRGHIQVDASRENVKVDWNGSNLINVGVSTGYPVEVFLSRQPHFRVTGTEQNVVNATYGNFTGRQVTKNTYGTYIDRMI